VNFAGPWQGIPMTKAPLTRLVAIAAGAALLSACTDKSSPQVNVTVTSELFQPLAFGAGDAVAAMEGRDLSTLTLVVVEAVLPALSAVVPVTV